MMKKFSYISVFLLLAFSACTEPYPLDSANNFEDLLVVEARITNKLKRHEVKLSRTYRLEEDGSEPVSQANVFVEDDMGNTYPFSYNAQNDVYRSDNSFQAVPERTYRLIVVSDGTEYTSTMESLTTHTEIESLEVERKTVQGVDGVEILVNSYDPTNTSRFYRYEYEETYKVIAPYWSDKKAIVEGYQEISWETTDEYERICYANQSSSEVILYKTTDLSQDRVEEFPVRFISRGNGIIANRYSIEVTQYVESFEAFTFYETLEKLGAGGSLLSPNQPGFISGNLSASGDSNERVVGFFEVVSESSSRLFFNYIDLFPNAQVPPYVYDCVVSSLNSTGFTPPNDMEGFSLTDIIQTNTLILYQVNGTVFTMVSPECGDCSTFASPEAPDFWVE